mgnify:CR=1 FL=1
MSDELPPVGGPFEQQLAWRSLAPLRRLVRPVFVGDEHIPAQRPLLFVGNHTLAGVVDVPQLFFHLQQQHGIIPRSLGEKAHWKIPGWRRLIERFGAVDGSRENADAAMRAGECVLVFPGGAREAFKRGDQRYQLLWGKRLGFARLALRHGALIVPFAAVGADDVWEVLADQDQVLASPLGEVARALGVRKDVVPPVLVGQGPLGLPAIRRQYFAFMPPVVTADWQGREDDEAAWEVRRQVEAGVEQGIERLLALRQEDPEAEAGPIVQEAVARGMKGLAGRLRRIQEKLER